MDITRSALLTDLYQLAMTQAYLDHGKTGTAVFEFFARKLPPTVVFSSPPDWSKRSIFLRSSVHFRGHRVARQTGRFNRRSSDLPRGDALSPATFMPCPRGQSFFADEPILRVTAPLPEAQLAEARLINILHFQSLIASKAARHVLLAPGKLLVDFGFRRAMARMPG